MDNTESRTKCMSTLFSIEFELCVDLSVGGGDEKALGDVFVRGLVVSVLLSQLSVVAVVVVS